MKAQSPVSPPNIDNEQMPSVQLIAIDETAAGKRLDQWLAARCAPLLSRSRIAALIRAGRAQINGEIITEPKYKPRVGAELRLVLPPPEDAAPEAQEIALDILYEDKDIIVLNKPAGLVVHPGNGNASGTLVNALIYHCRTEGAEKGGLSGIGGVKRPGIVHRLDKETSGVMVAAKNDAAHMSLSRQFADHGRTGSLERLYQAVIWGEPPRASGVIDAPLRRDRYDRTKRAVAREESHDARRAVTHYKLLRKFGGRADGSSFAALVECRLETGRTHQIRVHMAHIGHPLIGDNVYGQAFKSKANRLAGEVKETVAAFPRQALHAATLQFEHPRTGEIMKFAAPLSADMQTLIKALETI